MLSEFPSLSQVRLPSVVTDATLEYLKSQLPTCEFLVENKSIFGFNVIEKCTGKTSNQKIEVYDEALRVVENSHTKHALAAAKLLIERASILAAQGKLIEAKLSLKKARSLGMYPRNDTILSKTFLALHDLLPKEERNVEESRYLKRALPHLERITIPNDLQVVDRMNSIADEAFNRNDLEESEVLLDKARIWITKNHLQSRPEGLERHHLIGDMFMRISVEKGVTTEIQERVLSKAKDVYLCNISTQLEEKANERPVQAVYLGMDQLCHSRFLEGNARKEELLEGKDIIEKLPDFDEHPAGHLRDAYQSLAEIYRIEGEPVKQIRTLEALRDLYDKHHVPITVPKEVVEAQITELQRKLSGRNKNEIEELKVELRAENLLQQATIAI